MRKASLTVAACVALLWTAAALALPTAAQKCEAGKNLAAGKYAACLQTAQKNLVLNGDTTKYNTAVGKCDTTLAKTWTTLENAAVKKGTTCPSTGDETAMQTFLTANADSVATALHTPPLITDVATCNTHLATCNAGTAVAGNVLSGTTFSSSAGLGVAGTMPNNGAANFTPGAAAVPVPAGYYSGGQVNTDANLVSGNIKSGVTIFGVTGIFLPPTCGNGVIDGTEQCDLGTLNGQTCVTQGFAGGTLRCGAGCVFDTSGCYATRYVDNSNGTITDEQTGLQWEKKVTLDGTPDYTNLEDADNNYQWAGTCSVTTSKYCQPTAAAATACAAGVEGDATGCAQCTGGDGTCSASTTAWTWLVALNAANFGTHNDWRLPRTAELEGLVDYADTSPPVINVAFHGASCGASCTDITSPACACTQSYYYWSASTFAPNPNDAWFVYFVNGYVYYGSKTYGSYVRAVRGGS